MRRNEADDIHDFIAFFLCESIDIELLFLVVEHYVCMEIAQMSIFKEETFHVEMSFGFRCGKQTMPCQVSRSNTAKFDGVEVDEVHDISHIYILEVNRERIGRVFRCNAVDINVLVGVLH